MKLELKHLSTYLPYKLICLVDGKPAILNAIYTDGSCCFHDLVESEKGFESVKPILKPLSIFELLNIWNKYHLSDPDIRAFMSEHFLEEKGFKGLAQLLDYNPDWWPVGTLNLFAKYHFDIYGLISKDLAIDINKF